MATKPTKKTVKKVAKKAPAEKKVAKTVAPATSLSASVFNTKGKEVSTINLPENLFGQKRNDALVHQVVLAMQANARTPVAHTKDRGEVRGGGRKPWKQKGTGRARHGSSRSPIWRGGGTTFGPRNEKDYSQKINKKMRSKALAVALSQKHREGRVLFVDSVSFAAPQTKEAVAALKGLSAVKGFEEILARRTNSALILLGTHDQNTVKSFRNMGNVEVLEARNTSPVDVLSYRYVVFVEPAKGIEILGARFDK